MTKLNLTKETAKQILLDAGYKVAHNIPMDANQKKIVLDALVYSHRFNKGAA